MAKHKYHVSFREVVYHTAEIEAENEETAIEIAEALLHGEECPPYGTYRQEFEQSSECFEFNDIQLIEE